jgi:hypothetical protein
MTMTLIETKTLSSAQAQIVFTAVPQTFDDLVVKLSLRAATGTGHYLDVEMDFNGESARAYRGLYSISLTPASGQGSFNIVAGANGNGSTANTFSNAEVYVANYTSTAVKSLSCDGAAANNSGSQFFLALAANSITNSTAVTEITIRDAFGSVNFATGSSVSLYGIKKGTDGIVVVS